MRGLCFALLFLFVIANFVSISASESASSESLIYAVVMNGRHSGYMEMTITPGETDGAPTVTVQETVVKVKTMGTMSTITVRSRRETASPSGKVLTIDTEIARGERSQGSRLLFKDNEVLITPKGEGEPKTLKLDSTTIIDDGVSFPYLIEDLSDARVKTKTYTVLDTMRGETGERVFTRSGPAKVRLAGRVFDCLLFESTDKSVGVRGKVWVDTATGHAVRTENSMGMITYLTDKTYKTKFLKGEPLDKVETAAPKAAATAELQPIAKVPWKKGETCQYAYSYGDKEVGTETFTFLGVDETEEGKVFACANEMTIQRRTLAFEWRIDEAGRPVGYSSQSKATTNTRYSLKCAFSEKEAAVDAHRLGRDFNETVSLPEKVFLVDDNNVSVFALLALAAPREEGAICVFKAFHPTKIEVLSCRLTVKGEETISWNGGDVVCRRLDLELGESDSRSIKLWIDAEGRLLRQTEQGGLMVMELVGE